VVGRFTMHPNIWIREAAAKFIHSATIFLSNADNQCIILPLIRPYLKTSVKDFSELGLLDNLKRPLARPLLDLSLTWAMKVDRGIFWKPVRRLRTFSFDSNGMIPTISAKDLGHHALQRVPKNEEDEQWLTKLRNMGLGADDDFKLLALREYIWRLAHAKAREAEQHPAYLSNVINLRSIGITPQTVMFDEEQIVDDTLHFRKSADAGGNEPHTIADALLDASMAIDDSILRRRSAYSGNKSRVNSKGKKTYLSLWMRMTLNLHHQHYRPPPENLLGLIQILNVGRLHAMHCRTVRVNSTGTSQVHFLQFQASNLEISVEAFVIKPVLLI